MIALAIVPLPFLCALPLLSLLPGRQPRKRDILALYFALLLTIHLIVR